MRGKYPEDDYNRRDYKRKRSRERRRSRSYHNDRSRSRSKNKKNKKQSDVDFKYIPAKKQSDIKNHFKFTIPQFNRQMQSQALSIIRNKFNESIGPVDHVSKAKQSRLNQSTLVNMGFKYDIDALSLLQEHTNFTIHLNSHKFTLQPTPTKVFEICLPQISKTITNKRREGNNHERLSPSVQSYSSDSYSSRKKYVALCVFGIPTSVKQTTVINALNSLPRGPYKYEESRWRKIKNSVCEYLQMVMQYYKAQSLLSYQHKLDIMGYPVLIIKQGYGRLSQYLNKYQVCIDFPQRVQPYNVKFKLQSLCRVVQLAYNQQTQQGQCKSYILTLNDKMVVESLKKEGKLSSGIAVSGVDSPHYVYRPLNPSLYD